MVFFSIPICTLHCSIGIWEAVFDAMMRWTQTYFLTELDDPWLALNGPTAELAIYYVDYPVGMITGPAGRRAARGSSASPNPSQGPTRGPRRSPAPGPSRPDSSGGSPPSPGERAESTAFRELI